MTCTSEISFLQVKSSKVQLVLSLFCDYFWRYKLQRSPSKWCSFRLGVGKSSRTVAEQSGEQFSSRCSSAMHDQLHRVPDLWLVQLPSFWQDVPAQHTRHSTHRQLGRHCFWQRLDLVESDLLQCRLSGTECRLQRWYQRRFTAIIDIPV